MITDSQEDNHTNPQILEEKAKAPDLDSTSLSTARGKFLTASDIRLVLELHDQGCNQTDIARIVKCGQGTVSRTLAQFTGTAETVARQMRGLTDESIQDWRRARRTAAKRGDHRPAREMLEAAYPELRPQQTGTGNHAGVTVIVAVPGSHNPQPVVTTAVLTMPTPMPTTMLQPQPAVLEGGGQPALSPSASVRTSEGPLIHSAIPSTSHNAD